MIEEVAIRAVVNTNIAKNVINIIGLSNHDPLSTLLVCSYLNNIKNGCTVISLRIRSIHTSIFRSHRTISYSQRTRFHASLLVLVHQNKAENGKNIN